MPASLTLETTENQKWLRIALYLSFITIFYNLLEGLFSIYFGTGDETLALLGFGVDSFVEVISGIGIAHMVLRMQRTEVLEHDRFERQALRITGTGFYLLTLGLVVGVIVQIYQGNSPKSTLPGIIISLISILSMYFLMAAKLKAGKKLGSEAIISDAHCTRTCLYLSVILLVSSSLNELFSVPYVDLAGSLGIAWYAFSEGREAFEKVKAKKLACDCGHCE
ncbi:MAG: cation transporter [Bacteroidetes bacterium]|nr:cation transporter [Bacteroidota bacterium]